MPRLPRLYLRQSPPNFVLWTGARTIGSGKDFNLGATILYTEDEARRVYERRLKRDKRRYRRLRGASI